MKRTLVAVAVLAAGFGLAACGSTATPQAAPAPAPVTVTQAPPPAVTVTAAAAPAPAPVVEAPAAAPAPVTQAAPPAEVKVPMPDVVGMNLQAAQDLIQTQGVFFSRSEDATGAGRMQILDRDWVVVDQTPAAGELIGEGDALLYVKKISE
ncbi:MAG TPA: PASTA domain-containing protein [Nakamurella sp.]